MLRGGRGGGESENVIRRGKAELEATGSALESGVEIVEKLKMMMR
jgi:hypothetical protein